MNINEIRSKSDYQHFTFNGPNPVPTGRLVEKLTAIQGVLPDFKGKSVLDIGCDFGFWSFLASSSGAERVVGLDRSRDVRGLGHVDIVKLNTDTASELNQKCSFYPINLGKQYLDFGKFDFVYLMSLYHHIYQCTGGDHNPIWYWLSRHVKGTLLWENPVDIDDPVSNGNIQKKLHENYNKEKILEAASNYFDYVYVGKALHEPNRHVYTFTPKVYPWPATEPFKYQGTVKHGAGGATKAFLYEDSRRIKEIQHATGMKCIPGSLNVWTDEDFDWDGNYYRVQILDVKDRSKGIVSDWVPKWCRLYPVRLRDESWHTASSEMYGGYVFRFEGESYPKNLVEIVAGYKIRDVIGERVTIES